MILAQESTQSIFRCYIDTNLVKEATSQQFSKIAYDTDMPALVGAIQVNSPEQFWFGGMDELRLYNRALSTAEIGQLFQGETTNQPTLSHGRFSSVTRNSNGSMRMEFSAESTGTYIIEASTNLVDWEMIGVAESRSAGSFVFEDQDAAKIPQRFYRLLQP
jgi:hypothetical protein